MTRSVGPARAAPETTGARKAEAGLVAFVVRLAPIMGTVFACFLVVGLSMPVIALHVHDGLGLDAFVVGVVAGSQFVASLVSRIWSGSHSDLRGPRHAVVVGVIATAASGLFYLASLLLVPWPLSSAAVLTVGRGLLGIGESFVIMGALNWGLVLAGPSHASRAIAWVGTAMYGGMAAGAPLGTLLYERYGFQAVGGATMLLPLAAIGLLAIPAAVAPRKGTRSGLVEIVRAIWLPAAGLGLSSVGFGAITAFVALLFATRGWAPVWLPVTGFAVAFVLVRIGLGHLPDRIGSLRVAFYSLLMEAAGLAMIWIAPTASVAVIGAIVAGLGYSLVYPGFGLEAIRRTRPESRGLAMGTYTAAIDVSLGVASPLLGLLATWTSVDALFLVAAIVVLGSAAISVILSRSQPAAS